MTPFQRATNFGIDMVDDQRANWLEFNLEVRPEYRQLVARHHNQSGWCLAPPRIGYWSTECSNNRNTNVRKICFNVTGSPTPSFTAIDEEKIVWMTASNGNICLPTNCCHTVTATSSNCFGKDEISITGKDHGKCIRTHAVRSFSTAERRGENCSLLPTVISATLGNDITNSTRRETTTEYVKFFSTVKRDSNLPTTMAQTFPIATSPNKDTGKL